VSQDRLPPGPATSQLRQTWEYAQRPLRFLERCRDEYGEPFTVRVARGAPFVVFSDPDAIKDVFTGSPQVLRSGEANAVFRAGLGDRSLIVLDGDEHMRDRKLVLPPFHGERMRRYADLIDEVAEREIAGWPAARPFRIVDRTRRIALEVIVRAVFGVQETARVERMMRLLTSFLDSVSGKYRALSVLLVQPNGLLINTYNRFDPAKRRVDRAIHEEIRASRADPRLEGREDILSLLLRARHEDGRPMDDEHVRDELVTLLTAGHETTANTTAWALAELSRAPGDLERLAGDDDYVDAVVKETLRLRPVVPFVLRQTTEPWELLGRRLPAGVRLAPSVHLLHRRPEIYPEPDAFRPERFLGRPAGTYTWIPFGGGSRRCVGAAFASFEMKRVLRVAARAGRLEPAGRGDGGIGRRGLTLAPADGAPLVWRPA
jgi:cytochrome P450